MPEMPGAPDIPHAPGVPVAPEPAATAQLNRPGPLTYQISGVCESTQTSPSAYAVILPLGLPSYVNCLLPALWERCDERRTLTMSDADYAGLELIR
jgi:hypothetical protein